MRLRAARGLLRQIHQTEGIQVGRYGALLYVSDGAPVWNRLCRQLDPRHNNYHAIGNALQASRGIRGTQGRRGKWLRRLILRDLGLVDVIVPIERNK